MDLSGLNPHIRYAKVHYHHASTSDEYCVCYDCRIFFFIQASGRMVISGENYNIANHTAIFLPPEARYRFCLDAGPVEIIVLNFDLVCDYAHLKSSLGYAKESSFDPSRVPKYAPFEPLSAPIICSVPQMQGALLQCAENFLQKCSFYREKSSALLKLCLLELVHQDSIHTAHTDLCEQVLAYIHENFADYTLTNADISKKFNYHPYHLSRILKQETGKTLHQYLIYYRVRIAKNLLITTKNSIEQISWQCGFSSNAYFIKTFKDHTGKTPRNYRKLHFHTEL